MELLAVYIESHFLFSKPEYLNFGGKFQFQFLKNDDSELIILKEENKFHITNFFGSDILNISAIVGNNGVGKSSIMRILSQEPNHPIVSIYYDGNKIFILNQSDLELKCDFEYLIYDKKNELFPLYYSGLLDVNLKSFNSPINQSNLIKDSLSEYYFDTIQRQILFLHENLDELSGKYEDLPKYEDIRISINNISKSDFLKNDFFKKANIGKSMREQLKIVWEDFINEKSDMIHDGYNFLNNFETFILSLLVTDDMYAETNSNGSDISFQDVMNQNTFQEKLELFLKKRINNIDKPSFKLLEEYFKIEIKNEKDLIENIKSSKISKIAGGFDFKMIQNNLIQTIIRFARIFDLYNWLVEHESIILNYNNNSEILLSIKNEKSFKLIEEFISLFNSVNESLLYLNFNFRIFNIQPVKRLSTGEQSLLNFYSSIYSFILKKKDHLRKHKQYVFLLDEPEIGYHPVWKKKFVNSIKDILPELMKRLDQKPKIQIIFTSHDPLTLSDIPNFCISYLKRMEDQTIKNYTMNDPDRPFKSFGANINDLLGNSFFLDDELIGDFAKEKIDEVITWVNENKDSNGKFDREEFEKNKRIISVIDEPVIRIKLTEMLSEVEDDKEFIEKMIEQETAYLRKLYFKSR